MNAAETVRGTVSSVVYSNDENGFRVLSVDVKGRNERWTGTMPSVASGATVEATGIYEKHAKYGQQLKVTSLSFKPPSTLAGIEKYLCSGLFRGIGPASAAKIVAHFGADTLAILQSDPARIGDVPGITKAHAAEASQCWEQHRDINDIMVWLQDHGASTGLATKIYAKFKKRSIEVVSEAPYDLALEIDGIGFKIADSIARTLGILESSPDRCMAGILHVLLEEAKKGHTYTETSGLHELTRELLGPQCADVDIALQELYQNRRVVIEDSRVMTARIHRAESELSSHLVALLSARSSYTINEYPMLDTANAAILAFEASHSITMETQQREAVLDAARHKVMVITGGPGVGKSTILHAILLLYRSCGVSVKLCAPTGRAAKRMSEATGIEATTIHRLLEYNPGLGGFVRNEDNPIEAQAVVIDEASMLDVWLARNLCCAISVDARIIFVGDVDQLPSVGPGSVLRDIIDSNVVPTVRLTKIFRQADGSQITEAAHRINHGEMPSGAQRGSDGEFWIYPSKEQEEASATIVDLVSKYIPQKHGIDPVDIQVMTPMHNGASGTSALNKKLQSVLNPRGVELHHGFSVFREGDRVMQLKNDYTRDVFNGDLGHIAHVDPVAKVLSVNFDDRFVDYETSHLEHLTLAYATTIHKSQGAEYKAVVISMLMGHFIMLSRNLLYTAVTRGKNVVFLVADKKAVSLALSEVRKGDRRTWLTQRLQRAMGH